MNQLLKRLFDIFFSVLGLLILTPFFLVIGLMIFLEDGAPVFFRQIRIGRNGTPFKIWKFRTMFRDAESRGPQITVGEDHRITKAGCWIRKYKLDELPQLINVFVGEMSFVGPRPEVPRYVELYNEGQRKVLEVRPGITDPASIYFRKEAEKLEGTKDPDALYIREIMPQKLQINLEYLKRATLLRDIALVFKTIWLVVRS